MSSDAASDIPLTPDEVQLRQMWQEAEDVDRKRDIRSEMYKVREERLKDLYNRGEELCDSSENRQHSTSTTSKITRTSHVGGFKASDLPTHADSLADHSFLSLKSKEIRDSESPTKDSYRIVETRNLNDRGWNVVESNEASRDGKKHTTTRVATTSGKDAVEGGELQYAAKSEQKASVYKDGDDKNFTKSTEASSRNVIKQEAHGGDDNSKFYTSSTKTTSSSKTSSEHRSTSGDFVQPSDSRDHYERITTVRQEEPQFFNVHDTNRVNSRAVVRKIYTENVPNELKNHPSYIDGRTKVTTETRTLPDGSTVTSTRYETVGSTTSSTKHVQSSTQQMSNASVENQRFTTEENIRGGRTVQQDRVIKNDLSELIDESIIKRNQDLQLLGRDSKDVRNVEIKITKQELPVEEKRTVTTTVTKTIDSNQDVKDFIPADDSTGTTTRTVITKSYVVPSTQNQTTTTRTVRTDKTIGTKYDKQQEVASEFLDTERQHVSRSTKVVDDVRSVDSIRTPDVRKEIEEYVHVIESKKQPVEVEIPVTVVIKTPQKKSEPDYEQPQRRQPIKPGKSDFDEKPTPTEGQYDTTYRTDYVPRRISVEVSPTHDAFARSLRSISPDRLSKTGSIRSIRTTSSTSLRSTNSPDRHQPTKTNRADPRPLSPQKKRPSDSTDNRKTPATTTHTVKNTDKTTKTRNVDSSTLTRKHRPNDKPRSRSTSPTSIASDIEFIRHRKDIVTDLDVDDNTKLSRRHTEEFDQRPLVNGTPTKRPQKVTDKSATLPLTDRKTKSPVKEPTDTSSDKPKGKSIRRTDTYEERCKEILGIGKDTPKGRKSPEHDKPESVRKSPQTKTAESYPDRAKPDKPKAPSVQEFPSQTRKSPQKEPLEPYPDKRKGDKPREPSVQEFPSQIRRSPQKEPLEPYPGKTKGDKPREPSTQEFPSQIRKSPQKEPLEPYPGKPKGDTPREPGVQEFPSQTKKSPQKEPFDAYPDKPRGDKPRESSVQEFPSQTRRSPQKEPLEPYPGKPKGDKPREPGVQEFPSQIKRSPQKEPLEPYPDKPKGDKPREPSTQEFPSQIRRSPQKEPLEPYPGKPKGDKPREPGVQEFPSQTRKSPQKEPFEAYPDKSRGDKPREPSVQEFPSQTRRSPQKEPLEPYPDKPKGDKPREPSTQEFPSQIKRSPQKEPLEPYPGKPKSDKPREPSVHEFPSQTRRSPQKEPFEAYPDKSRGDKPREPSVQEFPSQTRRSPQKEPLEPYPDKPKGDKPREPSTQEFPSQIKRSPQKEPLEPYPGKPKSDKPREPSVHEFPSQTRRSPQKEPLEPYPDKPKGDKPREPSTQEFPSQIRRSPQKEPLEPYPGKPKGDKPREPGVQEFPSQTRKSPQKEPLEPYPDKPRGDKPREPSVQEFPSQTRRSPQKEPLEPYPGKTKGDKPREPGVQEFPSQTKRSPQKEPLEAYPDRPRGDKPREPGVQEFPSQTKKSPQEEPFEGYPDKPKGDKPREPSVQEFPSQTRRSPQKEPLEPYPGKPKGDKPREPSVQEFPSQTKRSPQKEPLEPYPGKPKGDKPREPGVQEFPSQTKRSPQKESLEPYPDKPRGDKPREPGVQEFPSQTKKSPQKEPFEAYPDKPRGDKPREPSIQEFPSQTKRSPQKEPLEPYPGKPKGDKPREPGVQEFPSQTKRSPQKESLEPYPDKPRGDKPREPGVQEFPSQTKKSPQKEPFEAYSDRPRGDKPREPSVQEFPSQTKRSPQKEPLEPYPGKPKGDKPREPGVQEFPSQTRRSPQKEPLEPYPGKPKGDKPGEPGVQEFPSQTRKSPQKEPLETYPDRGDKPREPSVQEFPSQTKKPQKDTSRKPDSNKPTDKPSKYIRQTDLDIYPDEPLSIRSPGSESDEDDLRPQHPHRVSLDDLPTIKTEKVSLDDIPTAVMKSDRPRRKISLSDLDRRTDVEVVDSFVANEKIDTDITLRKYKEESSIHRPRGIPDVCNQKKKSVKDKKKKHVDGEETDSTTTEEEDADLIDKIESEIVEVDDVINRKRIDKLEQQRRVTKKEVIDKKRQPQERVKPKAKPVEDFVTVTKTQLLQSASSKVPVEEPVHGKKFISVLCKEEEEDRMTQKRTSLVEKERINKNITVDNAKTVPSKRIVKKDKPGQAPVTAKTPETKKRITETLIKKEKLDTDVRRRVDSTSKKSNVIKTTVVPKVSTHLDSAPKKRVIPKKQSVRVDKTENVVLTKKITQLEDRKPTPKVAPTPLKKRVEDQPKQPGKSKPGQVKQPYSSTIEVIPAKRHVVSTIINIKPKQRPETITKTIHKTTVTKTITAPKSIKAKVPKTKPQKPLVNGRDVSTDEDDSDIEDVQVLDDIKPRQRDQSKPIEKKKKCITTKSIVIENAVADQREIIVDLKRSKSSREGTPDRICPFPISGDMDSSVPRYPDKVTEPEDAARHKPKKIADIPLDENEDVVEEFERITEVRNTQVTDESLLSVNEKVNKFLSTAEKITKKPASKVERPILDVEESLREDECLLSVSDKVNKFITTAEQLASKNTTVKYKTPIEPVVEKTRLRSSTSPDKRASSPQKSPDNDPAKYKTPERKPSDLHVRRTIEVEETTQRLAGETPKSSRRRPSEDESTPTGRLRSTETIKKAKAFFENVDKESRVTSRQRDILSRPSIFEGRKPAQRPDETITGTTDRKGKPSPTKPSDHEETPHYMVPQDRTVQHRRQSKDEDIDERDEDSVYPRGTTSDRNIPHYMLPLDRAVQHRRQSKDRDTDERDEDSVYSRGTSPDRNIPHYMLPLDRTVRHRRQSKDGDTDERDKDSVYSRGTTPDRNIPHYMLPLDRSLRERSPHKENVKQLEDIMNRSLTHSGDESDSKPTKFGVTLRRTDSGRKATAETPGRSSLDSLEIEEIFDLEYLEKLLETVVSYDIRRRIRTQIRLIKRTIEERTSETVRITQRASPTKEIPRSASREHSLEKRIVHSADRKREIVEKQVTEHHQTTSSAYQRKLSSTEYQTVKTNKSPSPTRVKKEPSPEKPSRIARKSPSPVKRASTPSFDDTSKIATTTSTTTTTTSSRRLFQTDLRKTKQPATKTVAEEKPEWVTQRTTLRKVTETGAPVKKTTTTTVTQKSRVVRREEQQPTDVITSSYGVGPTDDDGTPLFGLKALRARNKSEKTKVQGTVIRSQFYSENGAEPEGEISVTEFSSDPNDLKAGTPITREKGITSVTTTQKFGSKGTPALKTLTGKGKQQPVEDSQRKSTTTIGKVTRRGSVKEISQKFIENAVDTLKSERQSSYPKAGLILRTSSFKDSPSANGENREGSPASQEVHRKTISTVQSITSDGQHETNTFLTDRSKVTGVQDVISRMKNEAVTQYEDTEEDVEARNLLNKFIGSQVLLSGMESHHVKRPSPSQHDDGEGQIQRTIKITTTTKTSGSSKPTTVTRTFTHPITEELLQTVWDEQTLKLLLEQSTDYEDRRLIRARLREVMAEQEACAELVEKASDEAATKESGSTVHDARADSDTEEEDEDDEEEESNEDDDDDEKISKNKEFEQQKLQQQQQPQPDLIMQTNPLYNKSYNPPTTYDDNNNNNNNNDKDNQDNNTKNENDDYPTQLNERANRFNNKKLKMKRANTIDIPKPLKYYECDDEDSDNDETASNNRRNSYLALRGPIRVGKTSEQQKRVPDFQPKTESDKKFAAFLRNNYNTNEESTHSKPSSIWCNNSQAKTVASNWSSKFGNIKNNFDKIQPGNAVNSARNFWKSADDAVTAGRTTYMGPKISRQSAKNLQQMFEEKQKEKQSNIVTGQLKVAQPNAINKFSHAPLSAFKPVQKKIEVPQVIQSQNREQREPPLYLYSPKQLSPVNGPPVVPWNTGRAGGESRVLSIAASKFQNLPPPERSDVPAFTPRRLSKEKIVMPRSIPAQEKPHVPYVVKSNVISNNSVRKLSGQYDNLGNKAAERRIFVPGENYTIKYENPVVKSPPPQPRIYNADYTVTQHCYVPDDPHRQESLRESEIHNQKQREMYSKIREVPQDPQQFTSNYQYRPSSKPSPADKSSGYEAKSFVYERQTSQESVKEYTAVSSKVMSAPITQQAVTVQQNAPKSREQHDMELNLKATLQQKFSSQSVVDYPENKMATSDATLSKKSPPSVMTASDEIALTVSPKKSPPLVMTTASETVLTMSPKKLVTTSPDREDKVPPPLIVYNNVKPRPSLRVNDQPLSLESLEINERGETVLTGKFQIPTRGQPAEIRSPPMALSKSESWHQICKAVAGQTTTKPVARASPNSRSIARSKSSHTLAVPKQFEAGMSKTEMLEKRKTMEAYFGVSASTKPESKKTTSSSINRVKTSQKISTQRQNSTSGMSTGLCRSKTLPDIVCSDKLDDSSIDALFEDLFINSTFTSRTTTSSEGPVTTTSPQVTTRGPAQEQMKKPMSPFAKFRQLDKQNSLNSPPSTPKSPTGGSPLFKFTDPSLNQSANTVKQRLLQWCQMKTKEYENIQLDNFSTSWSDGMAFCALIHHFLPDAFDYSKLNPKNRRHNFTLAFRVADEKADIAPLLDVDDMVAISRPDWKCVFTYVQSIYRRFKDED